MPNKINSVDKLKSRCYYIGNPKEIHSERKLLTRKEALEGRERRLNPLDNSEFHFPYVSGMAADSSQRISLYNKGTDKVL